MCIVFVCIVCVCVCVCVCTHTHTHTHTYVFFGLSPGSVQDTRALSSVSLCLCLCLLFSVTVDVSVSGSPFHRGEYQRALWAKRWRIDDIEWYRQRNQSWEICSRHWMAATTIKMTIKCEHPQVSIKSQSLVRGLGHRNIFSYSAHPQGSCILIQIVFDSPTV